VRHKRIVVVKTKRGPFYLSSAKLRLYTRYCTCRNVSWWWSVSWVSSGNKISTFWILYSYASWSILTFGRIK